MKSLLLHDKKAILEDLPDPVARDEWVVVKVESTPICGSDRGAYYSATPARYMGHEGSGVVVEADKSTRLKVGDRVVLNPVSGCGRCYYCLSGDYIYCKSKPPSATHFAQYVLKQDFICTPLPDDISFDMGSLACCALGPALRAMLTMDVKAFDTVLITGLAPVGTGAVTIAKFLGARVIAVEPVEWRRRMAIKQGADFVFDSADPDILEKIREAKGPYPLRKAMDCSGNPQAERLCIDAVDPLGSVMIVGENNAGLNVRPSDDFIRKGLRVQGMWHCNIHDFDAVFSIIRRSPVIGNMITHSFGFSRVQEAFDTFMTAESCKVMIKPWE